MTVYISWKWLLLQVAHINSLSGKLPVTYTMVPRPHAALHEYVCQGLASEPDLGCSTKADDAVSLPCSRSRR